VLPADVVHRVGERTHHTIGARGNLPRFALEQIVGVESRLLLQLFEIRTECVSKPAEYKTGEECDEFVLPD
jgi:hypothetical protein